MSEDAQRPVRRTTLWLILAVCVAPFVASILAYLWWEPEARVNYGELLPAGPLPTAQLVLTNGSFFDFAQLRGKWVFVTVDSGACNEYCRQKLWKIRQVRRAQGKYMERIERVWLISDGGKPDAQLLKEYEGTYAAVAAGSAILGKLPFAGAQRDHIYLIDPLGNLMMRWPKDADPSRMRKDLVRLLKVSQIG